MIGGCLLAAVNGAGCGEPGAAPSDGAVVAQPARKQAELRILSVDDPAFGKTARLLRGEWNARHGGSFRVETTTWESLGSAAAIDADVVVFPARRLGEMVQRDWLREMRQLALDDNGLSADAFAVVRERELVYAGKLYAAPLSCEVLLLGVPRELNLELGDGPLTWTQLQTQLEQLGAAKPSLRLSAQADHPLSCLVLAAAASFAGPAADGRLFFDAATMRPKIAAPPFHRAVETVTRIAPWLVLPGQGDPADRGDVAWRSVPAAAEIYDPAGRSWRRASIETATVVFAGAGGRLASVTTATRNTADAFRLVGWLGSGAAAEQLTPTAPFTAALTPGSATEFRSRTAAALAAEHSVQLPRILSIDDYLTSLEAAMTKAIAGALTPEQALQQTADEWEATTERLGRQRQQAAYLGHLTPLE